MAADTETGLPNCNTTLRILVVAGCLLGLPTGAAAGKTTIAVASNFADTMRAIAGNFEAQSGHRVVLSAGSTGKHYAQIVHGAPFDAFFAADTRRPRKLEEKGLARPGSRVTYALGRLVLWSPQPGYVDDRGEVLKQTGFRFLAIANPRLAPYGQAARQVLQGMGIWSALAGRMVRGENIGQAYQYVKSGNAALGFVAYSQLARPDSEIEGSWWVVPDSMYRPIEQQAVLLRDNEAARELLAFVRSSQGRAIIRQYGYRLP